VLVVLVALAIPLLARTLNFIDVGGAPLGFLVASQGALVALVLIAWLFGRAPHGS
jgi:putative solute:sodium symporter small subunit